MKLRAWPYLLFLSFFLLPYILLFLFSQGPGAIDVPEFLWALKNTLYQALGSAALSLLLGLVISRGLFFIQRRWQKHLVLAEFLALITSFLPPIFVLLVFFEFLSPFPMGTTAIILVHGMMNAGLAGVMLRRVMENKILGISELCLVEGASSFQFYKEALNLLKKDIAAIFYFVFCTSFLSFSVPLAVGGGRGTTLEVLIYEKIRISNAWGEALTLSLIQGAFLFLLALVPLKVETNKISRGQTNKLLSSGFGFLIYLVYTLGFLAVLFTGVVRGYFKVGAIPGLWDMAFSVIPYSLLVGFVAGLLVFALLLLSTWGFPFSRTHQVIKGINAPSTALIGFGFLVVAGANIWSQTLAWWFAFVLIYFTSLYRIGWSEEVESLSGQVQVAEVFGASRLQIFKEILVPQLIPRASLIAGIASLWALGDFALSRIIFSQDATLALLIESLMSSYRIEAAMGLLLLYFVCGGFLFLIFMGISYVARRELN